MNELKRKQIWISDLGEGSPEIEVLLGADAFSKLMTGQTLSLSNGLTAIETALGWTLMGECKEMIPTSIENLAMTVTDMQITEASVDQLWNLEKIGICDPVETLSKTEREEMAKSHFLETVTQASDGSYSVSLPWTNGKIDVPDNKRVAVCRLERVSDNLIKMDQFEDYGKIFNSWLEEDIVEIVPEEQLSKPCHYLPHRPVFKPESLTTPIRPVFDASCKTGRAPSLNDCLEKGPNLIDLIPSIIMRFRMGKYGVISDIRKAFLMIKVHTDDQDFMRFLWWSDYKKKELKIFRHKRVVFGVNCSPFLLGAVLEFHLGKIEEPRRGIAEKLQKSLYVDNCVTSVDSMEEYEKFKSIATDIMTEAKMELRLWEVSSNGGSGIDPLNSRGCRLEAIKENDSESDNSITSVLGLIWDKFEDTLGCSFNCAELPSKITKREILSCIQKVYDPMGFLCPALLWPKKLLQEVWTQNIAWDEELDIEIVSKFKLWYEELTALKLIKISRNVTNGISQQEYWQFHMFCDASQDGYAAAVFLRTEVEGIVSVQLLQAKARVTPTKKMTIPRLELLSCSIGARLMESIKKALGVEDVSIFYWSDSKTAIAWILRNDDWGTFVGNKVREL